MKAVTLLLASVKYILFYQISVSRKGKKNLYILELDFVITLQPKQTSLLKQSFSFKNYFQRSQNKNQECSHCFFIVPSFLSPRSFYFPFPRSFLAGFSGLFCLRLLVFFSVKRLQFSFGTFSNIQQDNALAFTVTYTLILVKVSTSSNIQVSPFFKLFVFYLLKVNWRGGEDSFTYSLRCTTM